MLPCWVQTRFLIGNRATGVAMAEPVRARRLTDQEGQRLQQIVRRGKHGSIRVRRAMIIMARRQRSRCWSPPMSPPSGM